MVETTKIYIDFLYQILISNFSSRSHNVPDARQQGAPGNDGAHLGDNPFHYLQAEQEEIL